MVVDALPRHPRQILHPTQSAPAHPAPPHWHRCREILRNSPTALRVLKSALNAAEDGQAGIQQLGGDATLLFYQSEEGNEVGAGRRRLVVGAEVVAALPSGVALGREGDRCLGGDRILPGVCLPGQWSLPPADALHPSPSPPLPVLCRGARRIWRSACPTSRGSSACRD